MEIGMVPEDESWLADIRAWYTGAIARSRLRYQRTRRH
jgi:hypothetical protein